MPAARVSQLHYTMPILSVDLDIYIYTFKAICECSPRPTISMPHRQASLLAPFLELAATSGISGFA